ARTEPRIVPVVTDTPQAETAAPATTATAPEATGAEGGARRRYRFDRRPASFASPAAAVRPERFSSHDASPAPGETSEFEERGEPATFPQPQPADQGEAEEGPTPTAEPHITPAATSREASNLFGSQTRAHTELPHEDAVTSDAI